MVFEMVFEKRKQSMSWMEHGLQISLERFTLSMEDKMAAGALVCTMNYQGEAAPKGPKYSIATTTTTTTTNKQTTTILLLWFQSDTPFSN